MAKTASLNASNRLLSRDTEGGSAPALPPGARAIASQRITVETNYCTAATSAGSLVSDAGEGLAKVIVSRSLVPDVSLKRRERRASDRDAVLGLTLLADVGTVSEGRRRAPPLGAGHQVPGTHRDPPRQPTARLPRTGCSQAEIAAWSRKRIRPAAEWTRTPRASGPTESARRVCRRSDCSAPSQCIRGSPVVP
jgi:hypothetical protein